MPVSPSRGQQAAEVQVQPRPLTQEIDALTNPLAEGSLTNKQRCGSRAEREQPDAQGHVGCDSMYVGGRERQRPRGWEVGGSRRRPRLGEQGVMVAGHEASLGDGKVLRR